MSGRTARRLLLVAVAAGTVFVAYLAFRGIHWGEAWAALGDSDPLWLIPSFLLFAAAIVVRAVRWRFLFLRETRPSNSAILQATLLGYLYLSVLPFRAGEPARILVLSKLSGTSKVEITGTAIVERIFDLIALLVLFFALAPWLPAGSWVRPLAVLAGIAGLGLLLVIALLRLTGDRGLRLLLRPVGLLPRVGRERAELAAQNLRLGLAGLHDRTTALLTLGLTIASWTLLGVACSVALRALHLEVSPLAGVLVVIAVSFAASLPSLPGGVGIFEAATIKALEAYGVPAENALAFALVWHAVNIVPFVVLGTPLALLLARRRERPA